MTTFASVFDPREIVKLPAIGKLSGVTVIWTGMGSPLTGNPRESLLLHEEAILSISVN
ncbi:MAG: hypothetical protein U5N27_10530 [Rhizobium sp.]|nr:hypothetical protein [Rhizobium sp.]